MATQLKSPVVPLADATDAIRRIVQIEKDMLVLQAQIRAKREAVRVALFGGAYVALNLMLFLGFFWITLGLRDAGWSSWVLAIVSFAFFGAIVGALAVGALLVGKWRPEKAISRSATEPMLRDVSGSSHGRGGRS